MVIKGQLAELTWKNDDQNADWQYCVVEHVFDDRIHLTLENGSRYMHVYSNDENEKSILSGQPTKSFLTLLYKENEPVMAKKKLFGGYVFKPNK